MKILAVLFILLGILALFNINNIPTSKTKASSTAINYGIYRNAVNTFVLSNSTISSNVIPTSSLKLPFGWNQVRNWSNKLVNRKCYVWGSVTGLEAERIKDLFMQSHAIGIKRNGKLVNVHGKIIVLPSFIPEGNIVSVIEY